MNKLKMLAMGIILASSLAYAGGPKVEYTHPGFYSTAESQVAVDFVSIEDIKASLKDVAPITVTFDIDDTVLFSSEYFHYGFTFGKEMGWGDTPKEVLHNQKFWDYVAEQEDKQSIPKKAAKALIKMHLERGDKVVFITGRTGHSNTENGIVNGTAKVLQKYFALPQDTPVWYTSSTPRDGFNYDKTYYMKKVNSQIHYGDSDEDILAAREAGIRGVRIQRSAASTNPQNMNGGYGEEVLVNSAW